jgi:hypothetical protein
MSPTPAATPRLQAQLLEFLKFRVLASQEGFLAAWTRDGELDAGAFRRWLTPLWPSAVPWTTTLYCRPWGRPETSISTPHRQAIDDRSPSGPVTEGWGGVG